MTPPRSISGTQLWTGRTKELRTPPGADDPVRHGRFAAAGGLGNGRAVKEQFETLSFLHPFFPVSRTKRAVLMQADAHWSCMTLMNRGKLLRQMPVLRLIWNYSTKIFREDDLTLSIDVDSEQFENLFQALQSEQYIKPITSILGFKVTSYPVEVYPFYRILVQYEDHHRTEIVVNGKFLLIGSTTESGLTVYQTSDNNSLPKKLNSLF